MGRGTERPPSYRTTSVPALACAAMAVHRRRTFADPRCLSPILRERSISFHTARNSSTFSLKSKDVAVQLIDIFFLLFQRTIHGFPHVIYKISCPRHGLPIHHGCYRRLRLQLEHAAAFNQTRLETMLLNIDATHMLNNRGWRKMRIVKKHEFCTHLGIPVTCESKSRRSAFSVDQGSEVCHSPGIRP
ncbi:hypothetical protein B0H16DRAFT_114669 [Mycena metata]|uniref:Uncharacterized protein n=1 Tax=Mycena metata TaxID=1033252 RepID=A0AAD7JZN2_9AGAR|nr:hypothetical protein B0H16DRAFT_114669 [Mycena metata]